MVTAWNPEICHGDMALIDQSKQQIYPHTIYAVGVNEEIYIKQIETLPGHRMLLRSLNERYEPIEVDLRGDMAESVRIIGKVIWWCREALRNREDLGKGERTFFRKFSPPLPKTPHPPSLKDF